MRPARDGDASEGLGTSKHAGQDLRGSFAVVLRLPGNRKRISVQGSGSNGRFSGLAAGGVLEAIPPLDLGPLGAPGNLVYTTPVFTDTIAPQGPFGRWLGSYPLPNTGDLSGVRIYTRALVQDVAANTLGWVTTDAQQITFGTFQ